MEELAGCIKRNTQQESSRASQSNPGNLLPPSSCSWVRPEEKHPAKKNRKTSQNHGIYSKKCSKWMGII